MLRFDVPQVWSNVIRWEAFITFVLSAVALTITPWLLAVSLAQGFVKGFFGHHRCPSHALWKRAFVAAGKAGKQENAGAKMFAAKILFIASGVALALYAGGSRLWVVPTTALLAFSLLEWAFSFCAACWVYGAWYRRFPPS